MSHESVDDKFLRKRYSQNFNDTITVLVGPPGDEQHSIIHKDLICANSKFFRAACSKLWAEGKEKVVRLPEVKADTFQAYVVWVYSGKLVINESTRETANGRGRDQFAEAVELYLLGDVLDDLLLRNAAMRTLVAKNNEWRVQPRTALIQRISTPPGSRLRQMIVDVTIMRMSRNGAGPPTAHYPKDLLHTLFVSLLKLVPNETNETFVAGLEGYLEPETSNTPDKAK